MNENSSYQRYQRQLILKGFGEAGQQKLLRAKVLMIGAGGLGCPVLQYLVAAGVGTIGIVDDDVVALSNLHRQVLYSVNDIGFSKAIRAAAILKQLNPGINIIPYNERITTYNAIKIINGFDVIVDGSDNFATGYLINDACVLLNKPLLYGAVSQYEGQIAVLNYKKDENDKPVNYRDIFPLPPKEEEVLNCAEAGVLGVLPGIIGAMMANETIKLITGTGIPLINRLLLYNALNNQSYEMELVPHQNTHLLIPADETAFQQMEYERFCSSATNAFEIDTDAFNAILAAGSVDVIDIREATEIPAINEFQHHSIPLAQLENKIEQLKANTIILFCQTGKRSLQAAKKLSATFGTSKTIYSLRGGIVQWKQELKKEKV